MQEQAITPEPLKRFYFSMPRGFVECGATDKKSAKEIFSQMGYTIALGHIQHGGEWREADTAKSFVYKPI